MPEGDSVFRAARRLDRALSGQRLLSADLRVPRFATVDLSEALVMTTTTYGKHLFTRFQTADDQAITLHTHLKMEGRWRCIAAGARWPGPAHEVRVVLRTATTEAVGFALGVVELMPTVREPEVTDRLGPDLLATDFGAQQVAEAVRRLSATPSRFVGDALIDQTCLAGLGTIYRAELCFLAGLHPRTSLDQVPDLPRLVQRAHQLLLTNSRRPVRNTTGDLRRGREVWVYGRAGRPCLRCGTPVAVEQLGPAGRERVSYWCPSCQPG